MLQSGIDQHHALDARLAGNMGLQYPRLSAASDRTHPHANAPTVSDPHVIQLRSESFVLKGLPDTQGILTARKRAELYDPAARDVHGGMHRRAAPHAHRHRFRSGSGHRFG